MDRRAQSMVWSSMQRLRMVVYSKRRPFCRRAIADMLRSFARDIHPVHSARNARHFYLTALRKAIASPWIGCSSSVRSHLVRNTFRLLQGIAALHLQFRCMIQIPVRHRCRRPGKASSVAYRLLAQTPTQPAHAAACSEWPVWTFSSSSVSF